MKKNSKSLFLLLCLAILPSTYVSAGGCTEETDGVTTIEYEWDSNGLASATVRIFDKVVECYEIPVDEVPCRD